MRTGTFSFCRSALPDPTIQNRNRFALSAFRARPLSGVPNVKTLSTLGDQEKLGELFRKIKVKTRIQKCKIRRRLTWGKQYRYMSVVTVWYAHGAKKRKIAKYIKYLKPPKGDKVVRWFAGLWFWVLLLDKRVFQADAGDTAFYGVSVSAKTRPGRIGLEILQCRKILSPIRSVLVFAGIEKP